MISIIIPTLNEASLLPAFLQSLPSVPAKTEILVADANSRDHTPDLARAHGARVLPCPQVGRACQMNFAARQAAGSILLFLHADTRLPPNALTQIESTCLDPGVVGGGFERRFDLPSRFLRVTCRLATLRAKTLGWFLGDQAIFTRESVFRELGGFPEIAPFEDLEFSRRLARRGRVVCLTPPVLSSGRRFTRRGPLRTTLEDAAATVRYLLR